MLMSTFRTPLIRKEREDVEREDYWENVLVKTFLLLSPLINLLVCPYMSDINGVFSSYFGSFCAVFEDLKLMNTI